VRDQLLRLDPDGNRIGQVIRDTFDQLYDGENTGHFRPEQLRKTEKTHAGTVLEINLQRTFDFADGIDMDYSICGSDVDCKFSMRMNGWMLPRESLGHLCLVITADDARSRWSAGLVRVAEDRLNIGKNLDSKRTLNKHGRESITWVFTDHVLPENVLLHMSEDDLVAVLGAGSAKSQVAELFRRMEGRIVGRGVVRTVGKQHDYMKRIRANGGARDLLSPEGYLVLAGHKPNQRSVASDLGLPEPHPGEFVSVRIKQAEAGFAGPVTIDGRGKAWKQAGAEDERRAVDYSS
jgi:hypothetical protein